MDGNRAADLGCLKGGLCLLMILLLMSPVPILSHGSLGTPLCSLALPPKLWGDIVSPPPSPLPSIRPPCGPPLGF